MQRAIATDKGWFFEDNVASMTGDLQEWALMSPMNTTTANRSLVQQISVTMCLVKKILAT